MIGSFRNQWEITWREVWAKLAESQSAPADLFIQLFDCALEFLREPPLEAEYLVIHNDPGKAREAFRRLKGIDFKGEAEIARFLEAAHAAVVELGIVRLAARYELLIKDFLNHHNLHYRLMEPFRLRTLLSGSFAGLYAELERVSQASSHLAELMNGFEHSFDAYVRSQQETDLKICINQASMYAEGLASILAHRTDALGTLCDRLACWPHSAVRDALKKLYAFCSDYPGIRHSGNPAGQLRVLDGRDAVLLSVLLISFSGYLSDGLNIDEMLGS